MAWTEEAKRKMIATRKATMAARAVKKAQRSNINRLNALKRRRNPDELRRQRHLPLELPVVEVTNGHREAEEFAAFMAAAWAAWQRAK